MSKNPSSAQWWSDSVVYQVYPRSFHDSNGDGVGDIPGITQKLPYIKSLGVDVVWLSPVYRSPNDDNGYDISDYRDIMEEFGTLADFDEMLATAHELGLKIMMDLVVNHTSDEHEWFVQSRSSRENPYRDYYIWRDPAGFAEDGTPLPPNNWGSEFGGSAWEYDEHTEQFYLHIFSRKQPDLNWRNPKVRQEVTDIITFWQDRGVDGWRVDAFAGTDKPEGFPDDPNQQPGRYTSSGAFLNNGPKVHDYLRHMNTTAWSQVDALTVGEMAVPTPEDGKAFTAQDRQELDQIIHFEHVSLAPSKRFGPKFTVHKPSLVELKGVLDSWQAGLHDDGWIALYWDNHDQPRAVSRFGDASAEFRAVSAKALATVLYFQQGTPYIYEGQEIGMTNAGFDSISRYRDLDTLNWYRERVEEREELTPSQAMAYIHEKSRDNARTPMQWDDSAYAGFSSVAPWIDVNPAYKQINVAAQEDDPDSVLNFYRRLLELRRGQLADVVREGSYEPIAPQDRSVYSYRRVRGDAELTVVVNCTSRDVTYTKVEPAAGAKLVLANYPDSAQVAAPSDGVVELRPWEALVFFAPAAQAQD